jgi:hypothetical protein
MKGIIGTIAIIFTNGLINLLIAEKIITWNVLTFLFYRKIQFNIFYIIIIISSFYLLHLLLTKKVPKILLNHRLKKLNISWFKFKELLVRYQQTKDNDLQKQYELIRNKLINNYNYFSKDIFDGYFLTISDSNEDRARHVGIVRNLEYLISINRIDEWMSKVNKRIPEELDCFDSIFQKLLGNYRRKIT